MATKTTVTCDACGAELEEDPVKLRVPLSIANNPRMDKFYSETTYNEGQWKEYDLCAHCCRIVCSNIVFSIQELRGEK